MPRGKAIKSTKERFASSYQAVTESGCWLWTGPICGKGYGIMRARDIRQVRAHRVSWVLHVSEIPEGLNVLHKCDVRCCVNPDHLFVGTQRDNVHDMMAKKRNRQPFGESAYQHKLTEDDVMMIRGSPKSCEYWAKHFGMNPGTIRRAKLGHKWKHLPMVTA